MKYNLGCGFDYKRNWINVDKSVGVGADLVHDLLCTPWPIADESADEIVASHLFEDIFLSWPACLDVFRELYRIAKPNCRIQVLISDPGSSDRAVRSAITAKFFEALDLARCEAAIGDDTSNTCHALDLKVDFAVQSIKQILDEAWSKRLEGGEVTLKDAEEAARSFTNVIKTVDIRMMAQKPFMPGRSLREKQALVVRRLGGLGDVLMALSAFRAIKSVSSIRIYLETKPEYADFARLCPHVDAVISSVSEIPACLISTAADNIKTVDWSGVRFGLSQRHEVDAFLQSLGLFLPDNTKGLDIVLPPSMRFTAVDACLDALGNMPRIVLHPGVTDPNRTWPIEFWQAVARHALDHGCSVITIGRNAGSEGKGVAALDDPRVLHLSDSLNLEETLFLLRRCDMLISGDAGPVQIAGASDIRIVGLYSSVHGGARLPFREGSRFHNAVAIEPGCPIHPCYSRMMDRSAFSKFCQRERLDPQDLNKIFATWCLNDEKYVCIREPETLQRVKGEIERFNIHNKIDTRDGIEKGHNRLNSFRLMQTKQGESESTYRLMS